MDLRKIEDLTNDYFAINIKDKSRDQFTMYGRRLACYSANYFGYTTREIANFIGIQEQVVRYYIRTTNSEIDVQEPITLKSLFILYNIDKSLNISLTLKQELGDMFLDTLIQIPKDKREDCLERLKTIIKGYNYKPKDKITIIEANALQYIQ